MGRATRICAYLLLLGGFLLAAGSASQLKAQTPGATVFEGARLIIGDGSAPIENSAFTIENGRITGVGRRGELRVPNGAAHVDLTGKTVMPALVDAHVHMGYRKGTDFSQNNYTRENLTDTLDRFAYYGVAAILEAGTARSDLDYQLPQRGAAGRAVPQRRPRFRHAERRTRRPDARLRLWRDH